MGVPRISALASGTGSQFATDHILVTSEYCKATNGHVMVRVPLKSPLVKGTLLVPRDCWKVAEGYAGEVTIHPDRLQLHRQDGSSFEVHFSQPKLRWPKDHESFLKDDAPATVTLDVLQLVEIAGAMGGLSQHLITLHLSEDKIAPVVLTVPGQRGKIAAVMPFRLEVGE